jgi:sugar phosphate isomerase/epimerase
MPATNPGAIACGLKYSFTSFSTPRHTLGEMLALAAELGYDGIEPRVEANHGHGVELSADSSQRKAMRRQVQDSGVALACIATSCKYADHANAPAQMEQTRRYLDLAADLGCRRLRVFGGEIPPGLPHDQAADSLIASLRALADGARQRGVTICMETHDSWCDAAIVAFIMRQVDHPAVAVTWDVMHTLRHGKATMDEAHRTLHPWIRHVHAHDGLNRPDKLIILPIGTGDFDHRRVLHLLRHARYDGYVSGEWIESLMAPDFFASHLASELASLRRMANDHH